MHIYLQFEKNLIYFLMCKNEWMKSSKNIGKEKLSLYDIKMLCLPHYSDRIWISKGEKNKNSNLKNINKEKLRLSFYSIKTETKMWWIIFWSFMATGVLIGKLNKKSLLKKYKAFSHRFSLISRNNYTNFNTENFRNIRRNPK